MSHSVFISGILKLYHLLNLWYENSLLYQLSCRLAAYCSGSLILRGFYRLIAVENGRRFAEGSLLINLLDKIGGFIRFVFQKFSLRENRLRRRIFFRFQNKLYDFVKPLAEGSVILKVLKWDSLVMSCLRPEIFLSLFVLGMAVIPAEYWKNPFIMLAVVLLAILQFCAGKASDRTGIGLSKIPAALLLYLGFVFMNLLQSTAFSDSLRVILIFVSCVCFALLIQNIINTSEKLDFLLGCIFLSVLGTAFYGFYQYRVGIEVRADFVDLVASKGLRRVFSTMGNPNNYAEYLILFLPVCFAYAMNRKNELQRFFAFGLLIPAFLALVLTSSRASYLVAVGAAALFVLLINKRLVPFFILCSLAAVPFLPSSIINRVLTIGVDSSSKYRLMIWEASLQILKGFWVGGVGMGPEAFGRVYRIFSHPDAMNAMHAHNLFLQIWLENGIFAFIAFLVFFLGLLKKMLIGVLAKATGNKMKTYMVSYICALTAYAMFGMVEYVWFYPRVMLSFWIVTGLALASQRINGGESQ